MKKGTAVKFIGTENKSAIEKTYIWDIQIIKGNGTTVPDETLYLIQHPQGALLTEETKKDFKGFNVDKLTPGKSYMAVYANEIIDLDNPTSNIQNPIINTVQPTPNVEMITVTMPKQYFQEVKDFLSSQKEQMETNKMVKFSMKKEEYNEMLNYFTEMIKATEAALLQTQMEIQMNDDKDLIDKVNNLTSQI